MRRQIFIYVNGEHLDVEDDSLPVCWVVREAGQIPGLVYYGDLKTAANHATGCRVVVLVSGINILLTHVGLPAMNKQRLARAILSVVPSRTGFARPASRRGQFTSAYGCRARTGPYSSHTHASSSSRRRISLPPR